MQDHLRIVVTTRSQRTVTFDDVPLTGPVDRCADGIRLRTGAGHPLPVTVGPDPAGGETPAEQIESVCFDLFTRMQNLRHVIVPDSGRWYMNALHPITAWRFNREGESAVNDVKQPLFVFTGTDHHTVAALGLIGLPYETGCEILEPVSNRALNVHVRQIGVRFRRGSHDFPIPAHVFSAAGELTEHVFHHRPADRTEPWLRTMRDFADRQRDIHALADRACDRALQPIWCTWADWSSDDLTDELILTNAVRGIELGIGSFIIDDGWFGPGLDSDYATTLDIGDWEPDTGKIKDLAGLVRDIRAEGGATLIWCAPHAVGPAAACYQERDPLLLRDETGQPVMNPTQFYSLCFMCPEARAVMTQICVDLLQRWDFDGAKYDLFNWVPPLLCRSELHRHDTTSTLHGLYLTLQSIDEATRAIKPDYIVELKQNYGTPFFTRLGSLMRAGDAPYAPETNFQRTLHVQSYTPFALNDYQTFTADDTAQDVAVMVIMMLAAGVPAYSVDLARLDAGQTAALRRYNHWYRENLTALRAHREPRDADNEILAVTTPGQDIVFLTGTGGPVTLRPVPTTILNGTYATELFLRVDEPGIWEAESFDAQGNSTGRRALGPGPGFATTPCDPGGLIDLRPLTTAPADPNLTPAPAPAPARVPAEPGGAAAC